MIPRFHKLKNFVYQLEVDLPVDQATMTQLLASETWPPDQIGYGQSNLAARYRLNDPVNPVLKGILDSVTDDRFKKTIIDKLYSEVGGEADFPGLWGISPEKMHAITFTYAGYVKDQPGHLIRIHTDDRMHVAQGMIYFINGDDPDQATTFYHSRKHDHPVRIVTGHGQGFLAANTNDGWHAGHNRSDQDRYSIIFGLRLNL
jgi:hypothetical protein